MYIQDSLKERVLEKLKVTKNYGRIARDLATSTAIVEQVDVTENKRFNYTPEGTGRPELRPFLVSTLDVRLGQVWDNKNPTVAKARDDYDKGMVEIVTGRDGFNLLLYVIPRKVRMARKPYFAKMEVEA